jgi:hypothetical protein
MQQLKNVFSSEFLERYKSGEREFSNINLQYAEISGVDLSNVVIKNSKIFVVTFSDCNITNVQFINCEMIYSGFHRCHLENSTFKKCNMDLMFFEDNFFKRTNVSESTIVWSAIIGSSMGELDSSSSVFIEVITDTAQITQQYIENGLARIGSFISSLDIDVLLKSKLKKEFQDSASHYNFDVKYIPDAKTSYESSGSYNKAAEHGYGANIQNMMHSIINAYNAAHPYQDKKSYQNDSKYK